MKNITSIIKATILAATVFAIILFAICGPWLVKSLITTKLAIENFSAIWNSSDALSYYSTIIAALIGAMGIFLTILHSNKKYSEEVRNQSLPFFAFHILCKENKYPSNILCEQPKIKKENNFDENWEYSEYKLRNIYFILKDKTIMVDNKLTDDEMELIKKDGNKLEVDKNDAVYLKKVSVMMLPYEIENVGKGAAINTEIAFNKLPVSKKEQGHVKSENIKVGDSMSIHIFCDSITENIAGEYILAIKYSDIYGNKYLQKYKISIRFVDKNGIKGCEITTDYRSTQKQL